MNSSSGFGDLSPIDRVGRYGLGNGAATLSNYSPQAGAISSGDWKGFAGYYNVLGARAVGTLGYDTKSLLYLYRTDFWDSTSRGDFATVNGGAHPRKRQPILHHLWRGQFRHCPAIRHLFALGHRRVYPSASGPQLVFMPRRATRAGTQGRGMAVGRRAWNSGIMQRPGLAHKSIMPELAY